VHNIFEPWIDFEETVRSVPNAVFYRPNKMLEITIHLSYYSFVSMWMYHQSTFLSLQDYRANAEKAKRELDGQMRKNRALKVRFAPHSAAVKVKNLTPWVSNELLEKAFSVFGEVS
jgi:proline- and glutamine-rich splicing factor